MEPPYEVTERGWGEFEAQIRIHWKDPSEQITIVNHTIKLYPQGAPPTSSSSNKDVLQQSTEIPVLAETYDEVVFTDPTESFFRSLTQITSVPPGTTADETISFAPSTSSSNNNKKTTKGDDKASRSNAIHTSTSSSWKNHLNVSYSDQEDCLALIAAHKFLQDELAGVKQRFQLVNDELTVVDQKLLLAQQQKQRDAAAAAVRGSGTGGTASGERKRTKKSRSTAQSKKARTSTGSKNTSTSSSGNKRGAAGSTATAASGTKAGSTTKTTPKSASKTPATGSVPAATTNKKGNTNSSGVSSQALSSTKK